MKRLVIIGGLVVAGLAIAVYRAKLGAEDTQENIDGLKAEATAINKEISVMKAEEAYLTRPERIGPIAREKLGLEPAQPGQYTASEALSGRLGQERLTLPEAAAEQPPSETAPASAATKPNEVKSPQ